MWNLQSCAGKLARISTHTYTYPGVSTHNKLWQRCNLHKNVSSISLWASKMENTSIKDTSNKTAKADKNNLITLKPHTVKNNTKYRTQRLCIGFSPSLFTHRVNGASVAATVCHRLLGNKCNNATLSPIRDCSITSSPGPVYFQCCRLPSMGATMVWKQSKCLLAVLSVLSTKIQSSGTVKHKGRWHMHSFSQSNLKPVIMYNLLRKYARAYSLQTYITSCVI